MLKRRKSSKSFYTQECLYTDAVFLRLAGPPAASSGHISTVASSHASMRTPVSESLTKNCAQDSSVTPPASTAPAPRAPPTELTELLGAILAGAGIRWSGLDVLPEMIHARSSHAGVEVKWSGKMIVRVYVIPGYEGAVAALLGTGSGEADERKEAKENGESRDGGKEKGEKLRNEGESIVLPERWTSKGWKLEFALDPKFARMRRPQ